MEGRPGIALPVLAKIWAGAWLNWSVCTDLTKETSSATSARRGSISDSSAPLSPWRAKLKRGAKTAASGWMKA